MARPGRWLLHRLHLIRESFWFIPAVMALAAAALAAGVPAVDETVHELGVLERWAPVTSADGARLLLSTIAGSMITVAGVIFSITIAVLAMASSQFGPRLIGNFMRDRGNQVVLGTFTSTFLYCLLVLVRTDPADESVLQLSVAVGVVLAICSLAVLIYFIHHVAQSIQADHLIARVGHQLLRAVDRLGHDTDPGAPPEPTGPVREVATLAAGHVQRIDLRGLAALAAEHDILVRVVAPTGVFVVGGAPLAVIEGEVSDGDLQGLLRRHFTVGTARSSEQDAALLVDELVELAQRALSPGINDPFSAQRCLDRLAAGLAELARRPPAAPTVRDAEGRVRVVVPVLDLEGALARSLDPIRREAGRHVPVLERLLAVVREVARFVQRVEDLAPLHEHAQRIAAAGAGLPTTADREVVERAHRGTLDALARAADRLGGQRLAPRAGSG